MSTDAIHEAQFRRLLVVLDGSDRAVTVIPWAASLAAKLRAELRLVLVLQTRRDEHRSAACVGPTANAPADARDQTHAQDESTASIFRSELTGRRVRNAGELDYLAAALRARGLGVSSVIAFGDLLHVLADEAAETKPDLLAMSVSKRSAVTAALAQGWSTHSHRDPRVPLLLVGRAAQSPISASRTEAVFPTSVIVGLDGSKNLEIALMPGAAIAGPLGVDLRLVSAYRKVSPAFGRAFAYETYSRAGEALRKEVESYLERRAIALRASGLSVTVDVQNGSLDQTLLRTAMQWHGSMLAVGAAAGRAGSRRMLDATVERIVNRAPTPVLFVPATLDHPQVDPPTSSRSADGSAQRQGSGNSAERAV